MAGELVREDIARDTGVTFKPTKRNREGTGAVTKEGPDGQDSVDVGGRAGPG